MVVPLNWDTLLKFIRWQGQHEGAHSHEHAYVYADFNDGTIGVDGHLTEELVNEFLALNGAPHHDD